MGFVRAKQYWLGGFFVKSFKSIASAIGHISIKLAFHRLWMAKPSIIYEMVL